MNRELTVQFFTGAEVEEKKKTMLQWKGKLALYKSENLH